MAIYSFVSIGSVIMKNASSATMVFLGIIVFFLVIHLGTFAIITGYVRNLSTVLAWIVKWFSPFFYWDMGLQAIEYGNIPVFLLSMFLLVALSVVILTLSHFVLKAKGVRA